MNIVLRRNTLLIVITALLLAAAIPAATPSSLVRITDPIPGAIRPSGIGIRLTPFARIEGEVPPRAIMLRPSPDGRLFVADQRGDLYVIRRGEARRYLRLQAHIPFFYPKEGNRQVGFLSFAFHPEFATNGVFYTVSTAPRSGQADFPSKRPIVNATGAEVEPDHDDVLMRWVADDPAAPSFTGTVAEVLRIEQPFRDHNTGEIGFRPAARPGDDDYGLLYIGVPDGGSDGFPVARTDPLDNGQDLFTPLGAILRIAPEGKAAGRRRYGIPSSNPFARDGDPRALGEIYAYGLRNPHRFAWDPRDGRRMYTFDIGQWFIEEINIVEPGSNYGWGDREGRWVVDQDDEHALYPLPADDRRHGYRYPLAMYDHPGDPQDPATGPGAIAGGYVYRGREVPYLFNRMIVADFTADGRFFVVDELDASDALGSAGATVRTLDIYDADGRRSTASQIIHGVDGERTDVRFGEDAEGELYVTNKHNGWIYKIDRV